MTIPSGSRTTILVRMEHSLFFNPELMLRSEQAQVAAGLWQSRLVGVMAMVSYGVALGAVALLLILRKHLYLAILGFTVSYFFTFLNVWGMDKGAGA